MRTRDYLFAELDLDNQLRERQLQVTAKVDAIPESQFLISSDQEVVEHLIPQLVVEPIVLQLEATTMRKAETQVDVSGDPMRFFSPGHRGPFHIPGTRVDIDIPYTGEDWIFGYRTNPWSTVFPRAEVTRESLRISISLPHDAAPEQFKEGDGRQDPDGDVFRLPAVEGEAGRRHGERPARRDALFVDRIPRRPAPGRAPRPPVAISVDVRGGELGREREKGVGLQPPGMGAGRGERAFERPPEGA